MTRHGCGQVQSEQNGISLWLSKLHDFVYCALGHECWKWALEGSLQWLNAPKLVGNGQHMPDPRRHPRHRLPEHGADVAHVVRAIDALCSFMDSAIAIDNQHRWFPPQRSSYYIEDIQYSN